MCGSALIPPNQTTPAGDMDGMCQLLRPGRVAGVNSGLGPM
uniref:Uncharacterized protein n=1 Tax=Anguilla anguilla TaxID=7936 RepID=A0A0E9VG68_ANGAN